jgi:hypothetical protein
MFDNNSNNNNEFAIYLTILFTVCSTWQNFPGQLLRKLFVKSSWASCSRKKDNSKIV